MPEIPRYQRSIAAPGPGHGARLPVIAPAGGSAALVESLAAMGELAQKRDKAVGISWTSSITAAAEHDIAVQHQLAKEQAPEGAPGFAGQFDKVLGDYIETALKGAPNDEAYMLASSRLRQLQVETFKKSLEFEAEASRKQRIVDLDRSTDNLAVAAYNDPGSAGRYLAQARGNLAAAEGAGFGILPADISARRATLMPKIATAAAKGLIATVPDAAVAALDAGHFDPGLDADVKAALRKEAVAASKAVEAERTSRLKELEAAQKKAQEAAQKVTQDGFLKRLTDPAAGEAAAPAPSVREILASDLNPTGAGSKEHFIELAEKKRQGLDLNKTDPRVYRDLSEKVLDGRITARAQILPRIGNGLGINDAERLERDIEKATTDAGKVDLAKKKRAVDYLKTQLVGGIPFLGQKDTIGETRLYGAESELDRKLEEGRKAGKTIDALLRPGSPDYVLGALIQTWRLTPLEKLKEQANSIRRAPATAGGLPAPPPAVADRVIGTKYRAFDGRPVEWTRAGWKAVPTSDNSGGDFSRRPGEPIADWRQRVGK